MTAIQNIHSPALRITAHVVRKVPIGILAISAIAVIVVAIGAAAGSTGPTNFLSVLPTWTLTGYFVVLVISAIGIAILGVSQNTIETEKAQFDIR